MVPINATELAMERTRIASERTMMAWTRTAISLIGFGFSIPTLFTTVAHLTHGPVHGEHALRMGVFMLALAELSLIGGAYQHISLLRRTVKPASWVGYLSSALVLVAIVSVMALYALVAVLSRVGLV